jgi:hypothetical protein
MALNQTIISPLTLISGSISSYTLPSGSIQGNAQRIIAAALPTFNAPVWQSKIIHTPFTTTSGTAVTVPSSTITLLNSTRYVFNGYVAGASATNTIGFRIGILLDNATTNVYAIEIPSGTTATTFGIQQTPATVNAPVSSATNYFTCVIKAIVFTAAAGTPTFSLTLNAETAGTTVAVGPSVIHYRSY